MVTNFTALFLPVVALIDWFLALLGIILRHILMFFATLPGLWRSRSILGFVWALIGIFLITPILSVLSLAITLLVFMLVSFVIWGPFALVAWLAWSGLVSYTSHGIWAIGNYPIIIFFIVAMMSPDKLIEVMVKILKEYGINPMTTWAGQNQPERGMEAWVVYISRSRNELEDIRQTANERGIWYTHVQPQEWLNVGRVVKIYIENHWENKKE